ncbi:MAG: cytochrome c family protein, partial [Planctomycetales bacterium]
DPECISCHVTGWEPQHHFPFQGGYASLQATPFLKGNGCENCHGPGLAHAAADLGDDVVLDAELEKRRASMRVSLAASEKTCVQCHDLDNSPQFDFKKYWAEIEHRGKD